VGRGGKIEFKIKLNIILKENDKMIGNLIIGDWYIIDVTKHGIEEIITKFSNFPLDKAEQKFENYKIENPDRKLQLLLLISR